MKKDPPPSAGQPLKEPLTDPAKTARDRKAALAPIPPPLAGVISESDWEEFNDERFGLPSPAPRAKPGKQPTKVRK